MVTTVIKRFAAMTNIDETTSLDVTDLKLNNFQISDGAQRFKDFDESADSVDDEDMVSLFRSSEGSY